MKDLLAVFLLVAVLYINTISGKECPLIKCATTEKPVCAKRVTKETVLYMTFTNECYMKSFGCEDGWEFYKKGACNEK